MIIEKPTRKLQMVISTNPESFQERFNETLEKLQEANHIIQVDFEVIKMSAPPTTTYYYSFIQYSYK